MADEPNWEGLPSASEHRSVGARAWCHQDADWCYPTALCPCCDALNVPERWRGLYPAELLGELTKAVRDIPHAPACPGEGGCWCPIGTVLRLLEGENA